MKSINVYFVFLGLGLALLMSTPGAFAQEGRPLDIIMGRCHMLNCWWWGIDKVESIKEESKGKLLKVSLRATSAGFTEEHVDKNGYPEYPEKNAVWVEDQTHFVFCSKHIPSVIWFEEDKKNYSINRPFDSEGNFFGATEGIANLYYGICHDGSKLKVSSDSSITVESLEKPEDIFKY